MSELSAIEKWFYGLQALDEARNIFNRVRFNVKRDRQLASRYRKEFEKFSETSSTSIFTSDRAMSRAMGVKMVADELLAATGTVIGGTLGLAAYGGRNVGFGFESGEQLGRNIGSFMWSMIH